MKKFLSAATLAAGLALAAGAASANITFTANQGTSFSQLGGAPSAGIALDRQDTDNMLDSNTSTMYSLGIGGTLLASIAPQLIASASVIELTFSNNTSFPESTQVYLGSDATSGTLLGELFNEASGVSSTSANGATITATPNTPSTGRTSFQIALGGLSGTATSLFFVDTTLANFNAGTFTNVTSLTSNNDGFDIAELRIAAVPLPAGVLLLGLGLGGLAAYRRRQAA